MSLEVLRTKWKCILKGNRVLRLSLSVENIYFIFLEYMDEKDMLQRKKMIWNGLNEAEADKEFQEYKNNL